LAGSSTSTAARPDEFLDPTGPSIDPRRTEAEDSCTNAAALWTFAKVEGVEPTNNVGERAIRKAVLWRKGSFGSASPAGSRFVERMLTVNESLRAQSRSILDLLEACVRASQGAAAGPTLLPAAL